LFDATRPIIVNGIEDIVSQPDLLDRSIIQSLPSIDDEDRLPEEELWQRYEKARPRILGAFLDAVSAAMRNRADVKLDKTPRMADFARWAVAAEGALGLKPGAFLSAYLDNRDAANRATLENDILAPVLANLLRARRRWQGTAKDLLAELDANYTDEATRKKNEWPQGPRQLSGALRRIAPNLRRVGFQLDFGRKAGGKRSRLITLEWSRQTPSPSARPSQAAENPSTGWDGTRDGQADGPINRSVDRPSPENDATEIDEAVCDSIWDDRDRRDGG
jgi:hypothetical protein